jgi:hypothetical protein
VTARPRRRRSALLLALLAAFAPGLAAAPAAGPALEVVLDSGRPGPRVVVVGGTHGNEPSGSLAVRSLAAGPAPRAGVLVLVPEANPEALAARTRTAPIHAPGVPGSDLNRIYPGTGPEPEAPRAAAIYALVRGADLVLDLHEEGRAWPEADRPTLVVAPPPPPSPWTCWRPWPARDRPSPSPAAPRPGASPARPEPTASGP